MRLAVGAMGCMLLICGCSGKNRALNGVSPEQLLLQFSFDAGETVSVLDESGNGNDGVVRGAKYEPEGYRGGAFRVGESVGYIEVPSSDAWSFGTNSFSLAFWFKAQSQMPARNRDHFFIGCDEGGGNKNKWGFEYNQGKLMFHMNWPGGWDGQRIAAHPWTPQVGQWCHLAITRSGDTYTIFVDGALASRQNNNMVIPPVQAPLTIGQAENLYVDGVMDEVLIFGRALSEAEVAKLCSLKK
jgi:hypothetical protein